MKLFGGKEENASQSVLARSVEVMNARTAVLDTFGRLKRASKGPKDQEAHAFQAHARELRRWSRAEMTLSDKERRRLKKEYGIDV